MVEEYVKLLITPFVIACASRSLTEIAISVIQSDVKGGLN